VLGVGLDRETVRSGLEPLGFRISAADDDALTVEVPTWRPDVEREVDLIEEVARRYGYERFPEHLVPQRPAARAEDPLTARLDRVRDQFVRLGFLEARTAPFTIEAEGDIEIVNPLSEREAHLRRSLLPGLLRQVERNYSRGGRDVRLFEIGTIFLPSEGPVPEERIRVAAAWTGLRAPSHWSDPDEDWDVWDLKWILGRAAAVGTPGAEVRPADPPQRDGRRPLEDPFVAVDPSGRALGWAGRVPDGEIDAPPWAGVVWGLELEVMATGRPAVTYRPLPVYPAVERDLALLTSRSTLAAEVESVLRGSAPDYLEGLEVFDVYEGENIPEDRRSIAWRLRFRAADRTLTDDEVDAAMGEIVSALQEKLNVRVRGA
jgi:phenylalanyl-tRNA synthetase beta chain